jgi:hypothetical protein
MHIHRQKCSWDEYKWAQFRRILLLLDVIVALVLAMLIFRWKYSFVSWFMPSNFYEKYECVMISKKEKKLSSEHVVVVKTLKSIGKSKKYWKTIPYMVKLFSWINFYTLQYNVMRQQTCAANVKNDMPYL